MNRQQQCANAVWQAILPVRMGLRPMKGDESLAEVRLSLTSFDAWTVRRVADRVNRKGEAFDRAGGLSSPPGGLKGRLQPGLAATLQYRGSSV